MAVEQEHQKEEEQQQEERQVESSREEQVAATAIHASHVFVTYRDGRGAILRNLYGLCSP